MKTINYRGSLLTFRVPDDWVEEYDERGGGAFYASGGESPSLRLSVLTFESASPVDDDTPGSILRAAAAENGCAVERLETGNALIAYSRRSQDSERSVVIHQWEVANGVPPAHMRLAVFTLEAPEIASAALVEMLDREVRACVFAAELGD